MAKQKLELTWIGKGSEPKLEPRIFIQNPELSYGDPLSKNMLIHGDNLLALKALELEQGIVGQVKCIYIDPPYNTGSAFTHYNDDLPHSDWLNLMKPRLECLRKLLHNHGSIWISIDDDECHYLKILCDEVFGRSNFVANVIWEKKYSPQNDAKWLSDSHDHILVFAKNKEVWRPNLLPRTDEMNDRYKNPDNDPRGVWKAADFSVKTYSSANDYPITLPSRRIVRPPDSRCWVTSEKKYEQLVVENRIWFGKEGNNVPSVKKFLTEVKDGSVSKTIWYRTEVGDNQESKQEIKAFNNENVFTTPKPERLIQRILELATQAGDLVLDSFLGSGTTCAVAHKMKRRWIGIEMGDHAKTHCLPRLKAVVQGEQGGISKAMTWHGGGGFKYYDLAEAFLIPDAWNELIINPKYNYEMTVRAIAKHLNYQLVTDTKTWWQQATNGGKSYLCVVTTHVTQTLVRDIAEQLKVGESLTIGCLSHDTDATKGVKQVTLVKLPEAISERCEYKPEGYSMNIIDAPYDATEAESNAYDIDTPLVLAVKKADNQGKLF